MELDNRTTNDISALSCFTAHIHLYISQVEMKLNFVEVTFYIIEKSSQGRFSV